MTIKIGALTFGRDKPEPTVALKPEPEKISFGEDTLEYSSLDEYAATAEKLGFSNGAVLKAQILHFLQREEIVIYNYDRVARYMDSLVDREQWLIKTKRAKLVW